ncbi:MAG TPA: sel1 repeat family protein [Trinickia sp.]|uniref:SEL1-like repeat protein n=1 Tax=Trinickia sp. TaxID=2571163 RepID=UPI002CD640BC|nr:sel1 repeat family protein [Trinickia sp.]HVW53316.1 sel1 repeat family protein [Trinickia sp.]
MKREIALIPLAVLACACAKKEPTASESHDLNALRANLAFTCVHEDARVAKLDPDADKLFLYARYLQKREGQKDFDDIMRYYRIAAAHGHYKANHNAQLLITQGLVLAPEGRKEVVDLAMQLVHDDIPGGYFDLGHYLEIGYGVQQDVGAAMRYFRMAADLGNPEAQAYVAEKLQPVSMAPEIATKMWLCAAEQGLGSAANSLGIDLELDKRYDEAVKAYQLGAEAGDAQSAYSLEVAFRAPINSKDVGELDLQSDTERARRYKAIREFIDRNDGRNPKVPDIERIVPLPPAQLPAWDGTFQWEKERAAAKPPEKPSDELVNRLARDKHLDPATGLPLPDAPEKTSESDRQPSAVTATVDRLPLGTVALTGDKCPEEGLWCANLGARQAANAQRRFAKGETLPPLAIQAPRQIAILDRVMGEREQTENVVWQLMSYVDQG